MIATKSFITCLLHLQEKKAKVFLERLQSIKSWEDFVNESIGIRPLLKGSLVIPEEPAFQLTDCGEYKKRYVYFGA